MRDRYFRFFGSFCFASLTLILAACGGGNTSSTPMPVVAVVITPASVFLNQGEVRQFVATVTGTNNIELTWSVQESGGGTISSGGSYTAPNTGGTFHVIATSQADPSKSSMATVDVPVASLQVSPPALGVVLGQQQQFFVSVSGTVATNVTWIVQEGAAGGYITTNGLYTPPGSLGIFHVIATLTSNASVNASATVAVVAKGFVRTGSMNQARRGHAAVRLQDGRILITGGLDGAGADLDTAELYDPETGTFSMTGSMVQARHYQTATLLSSGAVLIVGGINSSGPVLAPEIYDPASGTFSTTGDSVNIFYGHTATALPDGRILLVGGDAAVYDPASSNFTTVGPMISGRAFHAATLLADGRVWITGGADFVQCEGMTSTEFFDPTDDSFVAGPVMSVPHSLHTATLLPAAGKVFLAGGNAEGDDGESCGWAPVTDAELTDPVADSNVSLRLMAARASHTATLLPSDRVILVDVTAEVFDPVSGVSTFTGSPLAVGFGHTATALLDGRVLVTGGWPSGSPTNAAELYDPN